ncbi:MAG: tetratricopeptide repeat protein [Burkholderiaceae bacterium]
MSKSRRGGAGAPPSAASALMFGPRPGTGAHSPAAQLQQAVTLLRQGQSSQAEALLRALQHHEAARFDALHLLGLLHLQRKTPPRRCAFWSRPTSSGQGWRRCSTTWASRCGAGSAAGCAGMLRARAGQPARLRGSAGQPRQRAARAGPARGALDSYASALARQPGHPQALHNQAVALRGLGRPQEALTAVRQALAGRPDYAEAQLTLGLLLHDLQQAGEALAAYDRALALRPDHAETLNARGSALEELQRPAEALACYDQALRLAPDLPDALANRANALEALHRMDEAVQAHDRAIAARPGQAGLLANAAALLARLGRHAEAAARYREALAAEPEHPYAEGSLLHSLLHLCDWQDHAQRVEAIEQGVAAGRRVVLPFHFIAMSGQAALQRRCAETYAGDQHPERPALTAPRATPLPAGRLRLGYVSADLHDHATAHLMADVFEAHDRERFELWAFSIGPETGDPMQQRLRRAFDHFVDARQMGDRELAERMARAGIDIAIDLKGYTRDSRPDIFAWRPAPLQVNYLGYPGTMGAPFIDTLLADDVLVPPQDEAHYSEQVLRLPGSYQANNALAADAAAVAPSRAEAGLPAKGFVFSCFNNAWKLTPTVFDAWMRILAAVPGSVLWLLEDRPPPARTCAARPPPAASTRIAWCSRRAAGTRSIWRASRWPTCSSTPCPMAPTPPPATRCAKACPCSPAGAPALPAAWAPACWARSGCRNWSRPTWPPTKPPPSPWRISRSAWRRCANDCWRSARRPACSIRCASRATWRRRCCARGKRARPENLFAISARPPASRHRHGLHRHAAAALFAVGVLPGGVAAAGGVALEQIAREPRLDGNGRGALAVAVQLAAGD